MWDATLADTRGGEDNNDDTGRTTFESTDPVPRLEDTTGETEETADEASELLDETSDDNKLDEETPAFDTASGLSGDDKSTAASAGTAKSVAAKADKLLFVRRGMKEFEKQTGKQNRSIQCETQLANGHNKLPPEPCRY